MQQPQQLIIVGGGTAGWLTACVIAAEHQAAGGMAATLQIRLIESPDIPTIGVGEGSWPSMRQTLQKIGISETEFFRACDVSPKQGSKFVHWRVSAEESAAAASYLHPFTVPVGYPEVVLPLHWLHSNEASRGSFANAMTAQGRLTDAAKAPKTIGTPDYQLMQNYGYHLNAGKFAALLQHHATRVLGVVHIADTVTHVEAAQGQITGLATSQHGLLHADFYIDCSGTQSLLLGGALAEPFISCKAVLNNDRALALQLPYQLGDDTAVVAADAIFSTTVATAQPAGWIWDISLPNRCGVGHVYASEFLTDDAAYSNLLAYAKQRLCAANPRFAATTPAAQQALLDGLMVKKLQINPGHYQRCMVGNCMAIGMAAGFIEPLEASALALVEWSAKTIAKALPLHVQARDAVATRINRQFAKHWASIIDFLKLHYVLSQRDEPYWQAQRQQVPTSLRELLALWQYQVPEVADFPDAEQLFPAASYSYVLYGMGFTPQWLRPLKAQEWLKAQQWQAQSQRDTEQLLKILPSNAQLLAQVMQQGFSRL